MKKTFVIKLLAFLLFPATVLSQMEMGLTHDNYNVTEGIRLNPAASVDPRPYLDIHILGLYIFAANNYAYAAKDEFSLLRGQFPSAISQNSSIKRASGQGEAFVYGPSFNVAIGKFSVGLNSGIRNFVVARKVPLTVAENLVEGFDVQKYYGTGRGGDNFRVKTFNVFEVGAHGGMIAYQRDRHFVKVGASAKYIFGLGNTYYNLENVDYVVQNDSVITINNFSGQYGGSVLGFYPGSGWSVDIGVVYEKKLDNVTRYVPHSPQSGCEYIGYEYKFGLSIIDIGQVSFKRDAFYRQVQNGNSVWYGYNSFQPDGIRDIVSKFDEQFRGEVTERENSYKTPMPTMISMQFDYNFGYGFYVNATVNYGIKFRKKPAAERYDMIAITPRIERRRWGVALPLSMNETLHPAVGFAVRFWYLSFGTDNFIPIFFNVDVYRLDAYVHLKVPILENKACRSGRPRKNNWRVNDCTAPPVASQFAKPKKKKKKKKKGHYRL